MAKLRAVFTNTVKRGATIEAELPAHEAGDTLLAFLVFDRSGISAGSSGWTDEISSNSSMKCFSFIATTNSTPNPVFDSTTTNRDISIFTLAIMDAPSTASVDMVTFTSTTTSSALTDTPTPTGTNSLVFSLIYNGLRATPTFFNSTMNVIAASNAYNYTTTLGMFRHDAATPLPAHSFYNEASTGLTNLTVVIKDDGTAKNTGQISPYVSNADLITPFSDGVNAVGFDDTSKEVDPTSLMPTLAGDTLNFRNANSEGSLSIQTELNTSGHTTGTSSDDGLRAIGQFGLATSWDLSGNAIVCFSAAANSTAIYTYAQGGDFLGFGSGDLANVATDAEMFMFNASDTKISVKNGASQFLIQPSRASYASYGTSLDLTAVSKLFLSHRFTRYDPTPVGFIWRLATLPLIGGSSTNPASIGDITSHVKNSILNTIRNHSGASSTQLLPCQNITVGDKVRDTYYDGSYTSIEYPSAYDESTKDIAFNVNPASLTCTLLGKSTDTIKCNSQTFNMGNFHNWVLNSDVAIESNGLSILNATVNLIANGGAALSNVTFAGCKEIINAIDLSGGNTFSNCVDAQQITVTSEAQFNNLANGSFFNNTTAIRITGDQTGSWSDPNFTMSGNTQDIEYTGATDFSIQSSTAISVLNSSTGTLSIAVPQPILTIAGFPSGASIVLHDLDSVDPQEKGTVLLRVDNATTDVAYVGTAGNLISISMYAPNYKQFYSEYTVSGSDATFPINATLETN